ncbi:MAG: M28 family peptidase [Candidatus Heimdallarchaeota archaeon]
MNRPKKQVARTFFFSITFMILAIQGLALSRITQERQEAFAAGSRPLGFDPNQIRNIGGEFFDDKPEQSYAGLALPTNYNQLTLPLWEPIFYQPDVSRFKASIEHLASEIGSRAYGSDANEAAQAWLIDQFQAVGGNQLTVSRYGDHRNIWATLPGQGDETQNFLLVGAHLDTLVDPFLGRSPGANDGGSGIALLLEVARILSTRNLPAAIYFVAFNCHFPASYSAAFSGAQEVAAAVRTSSMTYLTGFDAVRLLYTPSHPRFAVLHTSSDQSSYEYAAATVVANMSQQYGSDTVVVTSALNAPIESDIELLPKGSMLSQYQYYDPYSNSDNDVPENYADEYYENAMEIVGAVASTLTYLSFMNSSLDYDSDGLSDRDEIALGTYPNSVDTDGDGLSDREEVRVHLTDPTSLDTDGDGLFDGEEVLTYQTDPLNPDTDDDGLDDHTELRWLGTSPLTNDTDVDGLSDFEETDGIFMGIGYPGADSDGYVITLPTNADTDADDLGDWEELFEARTNPRDRDTDDDGYTDGEEVSGGSNPLDSNETPPDTRSEDPADTTDSPGFEGWMVFLPFTIFFLLRLSRNSKLRNSRHSSPWIKKRRMIR